MSNVLMLLEVPYHAVVPLMRVITQNGIKVLGEGEDGKKAKKRKRFLKPDEIKELREWAKKNPGATNKEIGLKFGVSASCAAAHLKGQPVVY